MNLTDFDVKHFRQFVCENRNITDEKFITDLIQNSPRTTKDEFMKYIEMKLHEKDH